MSAATRLTCPGPMPGDHGDRPVHPVELMT